MTRPVKTSHVVAKGLRVYRATYRDPDGRKCTAAKWYVEFRFDGRARRVPAFTELGQSMELARQIQRLAHCAETHATLDPSLSAWVDAMGAKLRAHLATIGVLDAKREAAGRTLTEHLDAWRAAIVAKGGTDNYADNRRARCVRVFDGCGYATWQQLNAPGVASTIQAYLGELRKLERAAGGINGATVNHYVSALRGFGNWMVKDKRASSNPIAHLEGVHDAEADAEHERRALSMDELRYLLKTTAAENVDRFDIAAADRVRLYRFQYEAGLRPGATRSLIVASFNLTSDPPTVTAAAKFMKRRKRFTQVLTPGMAADLREAFRHKVPGAAAFAMPDKYQQSEMYRDDLAAARAAWIKEAEHDPKEQERRQRSDFLAYEDHHGLIADLYSLRHAHGTALGDAGVPEKDIQASLHHVARSTTARYLHSTRQNVSAALASLPTITTPPPDAARQRATGTDGKAATGEVADSHWARHWARPDAQTVSPVRQDAQMDDAAPITPLEHETPDSPGKAAYLTGNEDLPMMTATTSPCGGTADATDLKSVTSDTEPPAPPTTYEPPSKSLASLWAQTPPITVPDRQLQAVIDAWPTLPQDVRKTIAGVVAMTRRRK